MAGRWLSRTHLCIVIGVRSTRNNKACQTYAGIGFKNLSQAQLLADALWYPDSFEPRQWLVYYISKPLCGIYEEIKIAPAILPGMATTLTSPDISKSPLSPKTPELTPVLPQKKDIKTFAGLLNAFPMIARQMQPGLERLFEEFRTAFAKTLPPPPSASMIPDPVPTSFSRGISRQSSLDDTTLAAAGDINGDDQQSSGQFQECDDEEIVRAALETAVTAAIDLFQIVDKRQLSLLGATTELTGPVVERLIERYVTEHLHDTVLWAKLCALRRDADVDLEMKIRQMEFVDIAQVGIAIQGGRKGKQEVTLRLQRAVEEFRKLNNADSSQQMMDNLLATLRAVTKLDEVAPRAITDTNTLEKTPPTLFVNADTLVSLLLVVVIRAKVKHLQARLLYMRHFIFMDDVESGEMGYALSTLEAVLAYLALDSGGLRRASKRNQRLWQATKQGNIRAMRQIMEPDEAYSSDVSDSEDGQTNGFGSGDGHDQHAPWKLTNGKSRASLPNNTARFSTASTLNHVYPFQSQEIDKDDEDGNLPALRRPKSVTLDTRSVSSGSEMSFHSRTTSTTLDSIGTGVEGDTSIERLAQTEDSSGESVPMMAIQYTQPQALRYLLSLNSLYPTRTILDDANNDGTTLLIAAVQLGNTELIDIIIAYLLEHESQDSTIQYLGQQDNRGRSVGHYLFNAPALIQSLGHLISWRQKDLLGQTPLFALCRCYDHGGYRKLVKAGISRATLSQGDGQPLHLDDHVDLKGNTLLHIINDPQIALQLLLTCDGDVNAVNDKRFTALMVASKYGRLDMVRALYSDSRVDVSAREMRGLTAVELAKDDEIRNRIDDLALFADYPGTDGRTTAVVRGFFVEDATIRLVVKSVAPTTDAATFMITTCRRSQAEFEHLAKMLSLENPASWIPSISHMRNPFQFTSRPSRVVLRDIQLRLNEFIKILLAHSTFSTHEMLWEFFLAPEIHATAMEARSRLKTETRIERVRDEYEPVDDLRDVEDFVNHARGTVRAVNSATKSVVRRVNNARVKHEDLHTAFTLYTKAMATLPFLPQTHLSALECYAQAMVLPARSPLASFHTTMLSAHSTIIAMLLSLSRPTSLITSIISARKSIERSYNSLSRSTRWPLGLLDETRQRLNEEKEEKARRTARDAEHLAKELRYTQQVVASELAGWHDLHEKMGRRAVRDLARSMLVHERAALEGMQRALRRCRGVNTAVVVPPSVVDPPPDISITDT